MGLLLWKSALWESLQGVQRVLIDSNKAKTASSARAVRQQSHQHRDRHRSGLQLNQLQTSRPFWCSPFQICKLTRIYCFSPNMLDIGWISHVGVNTISIFFKWRKWFVVGFAVLPSLSALSSCVFSLLFLCPLSSLKEKSLILLCVHSSLMAKKWKKSSFCCCKILNCQLINYSMWKLLRWSSVSPVSSTLSPKLELQIICKHEKKLLETILATQQTDIDKISPPRREGPA